MLYRRALFLAQVGAVVVLPLWLLIGRGVIAADSGWDFVGYLAVAVILAVALAVVAALTWARQSVRRSRAVSALDAVVLSAWYLSAVGYAIAPEPLATVLLAVGVLLALAAFSASVWQLVTEVRARARTMLGSLRAGAPGVGTTERRVIRIDPPDGRNS